MKFRAIRKTIPIEKSLDLQLMTILLKAMVTKLRSFKTTIKIGKDGMDFVNNNITIIAKTK